MKKNYFSSEKIYKYEYHSRLFNLLLFADDEFTRYITFSEPLDLLPFSPDVCIPAVSSSFKNIISLLDIYFKDPFLLNEEKIFSSVDLSVFSPKTELIYRQLIKVPAGETISYSELAACAGIPGGGRFAGNCMAGNPLPVIIPCHRVVKANGSSGYYTGGVDKKLVLLRHEGVEQQTGTCKMKRRG